MSDPAAESNQQYGTNEQAKIGCQRKGTSGREVCSATPENIAIESQHRRVVGHSPRHLHHSWPYNIDYIIEHGFCLRSMHVSAGRGQIKEVDRR